MTCQHVLGLIDAGPFVSDYPPAHLEAAWQHARQCITCSPALRASTALTAELAALPGLAPPADLAAAVLKRIALVEPATPVLDAARMPQAGTRFGGPDWSAWSTVLGGVLAGLAIVFSAPLGSASVGFGLRLRGMAVDSAMMLPTTTGGLVFVVGLAIYAAGLLALVGGEADHDSPSHDEPRLVAK